LMSLKFSRKLSSFSKKPFVLYHTQFLFQPRVNSFNFDVLLGVPHIFIFFKNYTFWNVHTQFSEYSIALSKCFLKTVHQVLVFNFIIIMITRPFQFTSFLDENSFNGTKF
jgi:hypothetical protein